jgi:hypothetical protein
MPSPASAARVSTLWSMTDSDQNECAGKSGATKMIPWIVVAGPKPGDLRRRC